MEDMARAEYPAMLAHLQPGQAVFTLNDRVKRTNKLNIEIADWLQERRRIEDQYIAGMRKLAQFKVPNAQSELGVFQGPWVKIVEAVERIANSHQQFSERIEKDVEHPLRAFHQRRDMQNINNIANNLALMARDLEEAQERADKLTRKGAKASTQKVDAASSRLESAAQQWDSQSPFVFETFQALDESRVNMIRDLLTQYQTHESDQAQRLQETAVETLAVMLEVNTDTEVQAFVHRVTGGKVHVQQQPSSLRAANRRSSTLGTHTSASVHGSAPATPNPTSSQQQQQVNDDDASEHNSLPAEGKPESKLRRLGTMFGGRRRQSVHAGFGQFSPQKSSGSTFGRLGSSHGLNSREAAARVLSPRSSASNLNEANRLSVLAENPGAAAAAAKQRARSERRESSSHAVLDEDGTLNTQATTTTTTGMTGMTGMTGESLLDTPAPDMMTHHDAINGNASNIINMAMATPLKPTTPQPPQDASASTPTSNPTTTAAAAITPPSATTTSAEAKDAEGFTIRAPMTDPISEAQRDISPDEGDQPFKLNIQNQPIDEEDPEAAQAALSNVANTLKMGPATRRTATMRGRRDMRHTMMFVPSPSSPALPESGSGSGSGGQSIEAPVSPPRGISHSRSSAFILPSEGSGLGGTGTATDRGGSAVASDAQSVRSGTSSFGSLSHVKHPEMTAPGLNLSIVETVSAIFEQGVMRSASIAGEIACVVNPSETADPAKTHETIRINNIGNLERIVPNRIFVHNASPDQPDQFSLDISYPTQTATAFSYRVCSSSSSSSSGEHETPSLAPHAPMLLNSQWKPQGDKLGLLLQYQLNPESRLACPTVTLRNLVFIASYEGFASGAQTKPSGVHLKDKHMIYWRLGDVTLTSAPQKILCRINGAEGVEPSPGQVEARWEYVVPPASTSSTTASASGDEAEAETEVPAEAEAEARLVGSGISVSRLEIKERDAESDPFADENENQNPASSSPSLLEQTWVDIPTTRRLVSGKYEAR